MKIDEDTYTASFTPTETGFFQVLDAVVAVNYNDEYLQIGMNPNLPNLVQATGGELFKEEDIAIIVEKLKTRAQRLETQETSLRWPFLALA
ncbi:MAG TPA: magnesium chelatase, partial [Candidatus Nanoarchaeia archaeon]|nr:magnesium chelatase [Candidatus Nanoarchaeia archaeon]